MTRSRLGKKLSRTAPEYIRAQLRREVNFGCPVKGCGSPYLEYHHFDPPFAQQAHHDPNGMIALCAIHHRLADQGQWTTEFLRAMKERPYLSGETLVGQYQGWLRRHLVLASGGFYIDPLVYLRMNGHDVIWFERKDDFLRLNIEIVDEQGGIIIKMDSNDWLVMNSLADIEDLQINPAGHRLRVKAPTLGLNLAIEFREYSEADLLASLKKSGVEWDRVIGPVGPFPSFMNDLIDEWSRQQEEQHPSGIQSDLERFLKGEPMTWWNSFSSHIRAWPVTFCTLVVKLKHPFPVSIRSGFEDVGGWKAGHSIGVSSGVVWDIQG